MEEAGSEPRARDSGRRVQELHLDEVVSIAIESAIESLVKTFLVLMFGGIAVGIAGGIWKQMTPSAPPGFQGRPELEATGSGVWGFGGGLLSRHRFVVVFGLIFGFTLWNRLGKRGGGQPISRGRARLERMGQRLSENWFGLVVGNAFGAMITATVVVWLQRFTPTKILLNAAVDSIFAALRDLAELVFGASTGIGLGNWIGWYGENKFKFAFWLFYLAAICDDLGLPNFKTLGRWALRRMRKGGKSETPKRSPKVEIRKGGGGTE